MFSARDGRTLRRTFRSLAEARGWRAETQARLRPGTLGAPSRWTVAEAAEEWLAAAGVVRTRSGERYKPSTLRSYEQALRTRLLPALGGLRLAAVGRPLLGELVDGLVAQGLAASTVRNALLPLRALYRRALARAEVIANPTLGLALPAVGGGRERVVAAGEAAALLAALPAGERGLWATALYAGLRRGELRALRWRDLDLELGLLRVERSWDPKVGPLAPKSRAGRRRVPVAAPLAAELAAQRPTDADPDRLVFGGPAGRPFSQAAVERARRHWRQAGLQPLGLHDCRHSYAALMIAAGVNPKALQQYVGHASISVTLDRYGHLMPGNEHQAGGLLAGYLERETADG